VQYFWVCLRKEEFEPDALKESALLGRYGGGCLVKKRADGARWWVSLSYGGHGHGCCSSLFTGRLGISGCWGNTLAANVATVR
jgi:hypothetical protein